MDKKQLSQIGHLNREIEMLKRQLDSIESYIQPEFTTDSVKGSDTNFPFTQHKIKIYGIDWKDHESRVKRLHNQLSRRISELMGLVEEINSYIATIDDSEIRQILTWRYVNGFTWRQVAAHIGGGNSEDSARKIHDRFLQRQ